MLAAPAGLVLALCVFLPAVKGCNDPIYPFEVPPAWPPYVLGAIVVAMALTRRLGVLRALTMAALTIATLSGGVFGLLVGWGGRGFELVWALGLGVIAVLLLVGVLRGRGTEERAARMVIGVGVLCTPWFALLAFDPDGLIGVRVSLAASVALIIAGAEWRRELARVRAGTHPVPPARARSG